MASLDLVLLMFAGGALGGMVVALLGGATVLQMIAFIVVSACCWSWSARSPRSTWSTALRCSSTASRRSSAARPR